VLGTENNWYTQMILELLTLIFLILLMLFVVCGITLIYSRIEKRSASFVDNNGHGYDSHEYSARRLCREFTDPLPRYEPRSASLPSYTECSQIICNNN
jgi:hypothetical protein